jgi:hypothetical protein
MTTAKEHTGVEGFYTPKHLLSASLHTLHEPQTEILRMVKNPAIIAQIERSVSQLPTECWLRDADAHNMDSLDAVSTITRLCRIHFSQYS